MNLERIEETIDTAKMADSRVFMVGGAYQLIADLVRSGLGAVTMMDFDTVSASNVARQDFTARDVDRAKVDVYADALRRINSDVEVERYQRDYCSLTEEEHDEIVGPADLAIFATDCFPAQARGSAEIMRMDKPAMWMGLYRRGRAGELVYYMPGITPACYRCICIDRYKHAQAAAVDIPSAGATIFDLRFLDAVAGPVALGILTHRSDNRMGRLIEQLGVRNLIQTKMDPEYTLGEQDVFSECLGNHPANFSFSTIAMPMEPEDNCPDCRLREAFVDPFEG